MFIKHNDIYITENINNLPIKSLNIGDKVVLLETKKEEYSEKNSITNMVLASKLCYNNNDLIIHFDCINVESVKHDELEEDESSSHNKAYSEIVEEHFRKSYLILQNGELFALHKTKEYDRNIDYEGNVNEEEDELNKYIYNCLVEEGVYKTLLLEKNKFKKNNKELVRFLPIKLHQDSYLVLILYSHFDETIHHWWKLKSVKLINKNGDVFNLSVDFEKLFEKIKSINMNQQYNQHYFLSNDSIKQFENSMNIFNYDIKQYLEVDDFEKQIMIRKLESEYHSLDVDFNKLFSPIYKSKNYDFEVYVDSLSKFHPSTLIYSNGEIKLSYLLDEELKNEYRIGKRILEFKIINQSGISPFDGKYYRHGKLDESMMKEHIYYKDFGGIILKDYSWNAYEKVRYFININGYYIPADEEKDKVQIKELKVRKEMFNKLNQS